MSTMPAPSIAPGRSPSSAQAMRMAVMGTHRLDRLATVAGRRSTMKAQSTQARLVASTAEYSRPQSSPGAQSMARDGISAAASARNSVPISICQAVNASGVGWCRWNMRLDSTVPSAQEQPPVIASTVLCQLPRPRHGSMTQTRPQTASAMPPHWRRPGRSRSSHQANSTDQNGMV